MPKNAADALSVMTRSLSCGGGEGGGLLGRCGSLPFGGFSRESARRRAVDKCFVRIGIRLDLTDPAGMGSRNTVLSMVEMRDRNGEALPANKKRGFKNTQAISTNCSGIVSVTHVISCEAGHLGLMTLIQAIQEQNSVGDYLGSVDRDCQIGGIRWSAYPKVT